MKILWQLKWSNPHTNPPDGMPRVLAEEITERGEEPRNLYKMRALGDPYGIHWLGDANPKPIRRLPEETKQRMRRKTLERRTRERTPLFAEEVIAERLATDPDYYGKP